MSVVQAVSRLGHAPRMCHLHCVASGLCILFGHLLLRWMKCDDASFCALLDELSVHHSARARKATVLAFASRLWPKPIRR